jgi:hypothetical protein
VASYTFTHQAQPTQELLYSLANFDGIHYLHIAQRGYIDEARFFPLYPIAINILSWPLRLVVSTPVALIFASLTISFCALMGSLYLLTDLQNLPSSNWRMPLTILAFPTSFFLVATYTESLFLFLALTTLWLIKTKHWYLACVVAALATATRLVGVVVWIALIGEWLNHSGISLKISLPPTIHNLTKSIQQLFSQIVNLITNNKLLSLCLVLSTTPFFVFMWYNHVVWGDSLYFLHAHQLLGNGRSAASFINPLITAYRYIKILTTLPITQYEWSVALLEAIFTSGACIGLVWTWHKKLVPRSWLLMCGGFLAIPILSGTLTGMPRYVLICFPVYWLINQLPNKWWLSYVSAGIIFNLFLFLLFAHGYYIA